MSTAGYLQDAKNQQKRLAETITSKGITATATEKYTDLVDKVAQIENLKGEERTLENFTNVLSEPKNVVQLEYPNDTPKTLDAKLVNKNLFDKDNANIVVGYIDANSIKTSSNTRTVYIPCAPNTTYTVSKIATARFVVAFTNVIPAVDATVTNEIRDDTATSITATSGVDSKYIVVWVYNSAYDTSITLDEILATLQIELGSTATVYTPYISDLTSVNVTGCGRNILPYPYTDTTKTLNEITFTINSDSTITVNGTATANSLFKLNNYSKETNLKLTPGQTYTLSTGLSTAFKGMSIVCSYYSKDETAYKQWIQNSTKVSSVFPDDGYSIACYVVVLKDTTVNNVTLKPQLEIGSVANYYEPYQGQTYTPTVTGEVTGITNLYPTTTLLTDNSGVVFEQVTGQTYKEILPSTDKNGITKVYQPSVDSTIDSNITSDNIKQGISILGVTGDYICNYTYDETTKELVLLI